MISSRDMALWGSRLAADDWAWVTWKYLLGTTALVALWALFMFVFISILLPNRFLNMPKNTSVFAAFIMTWLVAIMAHGAVFGAGPYGYVLQSSLGGLYSPIEAWTFKWMTLLGLISSF